MIRKNLKIFLTCALIFITLLTFSVCFADNDNTSEAVPISMPEDENNTAVVTSDSSKNSATESTPEIINGDLYLFDTDVKMDKLVDGNVFIIGNNVEVTGQVNGNLFVLANNLKFEENSYVVSSIFACASSIYYNGACNDFYVTANNLEMTFNSYVIRDLKASAANVIFQAAVGRDVDLSCSKANLGEGEQIPVIYGNFRYTSPSELSIPDGVMNGNGSVTYNSKNTESKIKSISIKDILVNTITYIITALAIFLIIKKFMPKFYTKIENQKISFVELLKCFGFGFAMIIAAFLVFIMLLCTQIGIKLAFVFILIFIIIWILAVPIFSILISKLFKSEKTLKRCLIIAIVNVVFYGLTIIPVVGGIFAFIIFMVSLGMMFNLTLPKKELTPEEIENIKKAKQLAKENKIKQKEEKIKEKELNKENKLKQEEKKAKEKEDEINPEEKIKKDKEN